jgi:hypothetical protein
VFAFSPLPCLGLIVFRQAAWFGTEKTNFGRRFAPLSTKLILGPQLVL